MKVLGEKIREARIKKRISYKTLHKRTKISIDTIQAIEEGNVKHLPLTYFIAFVRTLSREVGLNPDALLQEYNVRQRRLLEEKIQIEDHERIYQKVGGIWKKWNRWILLGMIGLGFVVLIGFYISYGRKFFIEPNIAELTEQAGDSTMPVLVSPDSIGTDRFILHGISLNNTWIEVRVDSGKFETVFMQRGEKTEWQVKKSIFLGLEDSKGIRLSLNDQLLDWPGDAWVSGVDFTITAEGIVEQSPREKKPNDLRIEESDGDTGVVLIGEIDEDILFQKFPVYEYNRTRYQPNSVILSRIEAINPNLALVCFLGTWHSLSAEVIPKLLRILQMSYLPHVTVKMIGVDQNMENEQGLAKQYHIQGLPAILFFRDQLEVGRIVGQPGDRIEVQFLEIVERANLFLGESQQQE